MMMKTLAVLFASMASHSCVFNAEASSVPPPSVLNKADLSDLRFDSARRQEDTASKTAPNADEPESFTRRMMLTPDQGKVQPLGNGVFAPGPQGPMLLNSTEVNVEYLKYLEALGSGEPVPWLCRGCGLCRGPSFPVQFTTTTTNAHYNLTATCRR